MTITTKEFKGYGFGFVPQKLIVNSRPELSNFPLNILFTGIINKDSQIVAASAVYEPDFSSFKEDIDEINEKIQKMNYLNKYGSNWRVEIRYKKERKSWFGIKYDGNESKLLASGSIWGAFFSHLTIHGLSDGEPCLFQTLDELADLALANEYIKNE